LGRAHEEALAPEPTRPSPQPKTPKRALSGKVVGCFAYNRSVQQPAARTRTATTGNLDRTTDKSAEVSAVTHSKANVVAINSAPCESLARGPAVPDASCHPADDIVVKPTAWRVSDSATRAVHIGANCRNVWLSRYTMYYNLVRSHQTLKVTPAMAAGVTDRLWEVKDLVEMLEAVEASQKRAA
jgi:hypothetical protein